MNVLRDQLQAQVAAAWAGCGSEMQIAIARSYAAYAVTPAYITAWLKRPAHIQRSIKLAAAMGARVVFHGSAQYVSISLEF